tara:strand:+ start:129 stop:479 length:351 start_codon:yes stop_codon:yes gene_type:complete
MMDGWQEYLCLKRLSTTEYELSVRRYEILGEVFDYTDEGGEVTLPTEIGGGKVLDHDGEYIFGGTLEISEIDGFVKFSRPDQVEIIEWLNKVYWMYDSVLERITEILRTSKPTFPR